MNSINVVHISKTPLVGAPGVISKYLNLNNDFNSCHFFLNEYPEQLRGFFTKNSIHLDISNKLVRELFIKKISSADIIHIHNDINSDDVIELLLTHTNNAYFFYQIHSPLREPPLYIDKSKDLPFYFSKKLVIAQAHPRLYANFEFVPNIVDVYPKANIINKECKNKIRILFSPTHKRTNGVIFSTKFTENQIKYFDEIKKSCDFDLIDFDKPISPVMLLELRRLADISIDEIASGGFHQVSYEGLACGNVVINNADIFAKGNFAESIGANELPPFFRACDQDFIEKILWLKNNAEELQKMKENSMAYYAKYMMPLRLIEIFKKKYKETISC